MYVLLRGDGLAWIASSLNVFMVMLSTTGC